MSLCPWTFCADVDVTLTDRNVFSSVDSQDRSLILHSSVKTQGRDVVSLSLNEEMTSSLEETSEHPLKLGPSLKRCMTG